MTDRTDPRSHVRRHVAHGAITDVVTGTARYGRKGLVVTAGAETGDQNAPDLVNTSLGGMSRACLHCGRPFSPRPRSRKDAKYCSSTCRAARHQARRAALLDELAATLAHVADLVRQLRDGRTP